MMLTHFNRTNGCCAVDAGRKGARETRTGPGVSRVTGGRQGKGCLIFHENFNVVISIVLWMEIMVSLSDAGVMQEEQRKRQEEEERRQEEEQRRLQQAEEEERRKIAREKEVCSICILIAINIF
jgi:signal transduction histidine kinase